MHYLELTLNPPEGIIAGPINEENFFEWEALITYATISYCVMHASIFNSLIVLVVRKELVLKVEYFQPN